MAQYAPDGNKRPWWWVGESAHNKLLLLIFAILVANSGWHLREVLRAHGLTPWTALLLGSFVGFVALICRSVLATRRALATERAQSEQAPQ